jgi:predicted nucleic acid-binding protein
MKIVFTDTSYLLALEFKSDQNHQVAQKHWQNLQQLSFSLIITSYVFDETVTYINSRERHDRAVQIGEMLLSSPSVEIVHVNEDLFFEGWTIFQKYHDKRYSLTDCISFVVMRQKHLDTALTFDKHFVQAGFIIEP